MTQAGELDLGAIFGRADELQLLESALASALDGAGGLVLIGGEPGIGKTRLAGELAARATDAGTTVLWGRAWEAGGAPSYWPWTQALGEQASKIDASRLQQLSPGTAALAHVLPELAGAGLPSDASTPGDPATARFELFRAVTGLLRLVADDHPLVLVLDDVHAADTPSLLLLQYVAGQLNDMPVLLVVTYRDLEVDRDHPLRAVLADTTRHRSTHRLSLPGLPAHDVAQIIEAITGEPPSPAVVAAVHRETDGNPLFVTEVVRLAAAQGRAGEVDAAYWERVVPESVREVIGVRLDRLSRECARTLSLASVMGRELDLALLTQLSGLDGDELADVVDEAAAAGLVGETPEAPGRLRFAHALVRDTLYDELPPARRSRLHLRAAEAMEELGRAADPQHLTEYAHHLVRAGQHASVAAVATATKRAADAAMLSLAYEEAVRLLRLGLGVLEAASGDPAAGDARSDLVLALADAAARAGDLTEAQARYLEAASLGRLGRPQVLARAAMGYGGRFLWTRAGRDPHVIPLLEEALAAMDDAPTDLRVRVLARLAAASRDDPDLGKRDALSARAVQLARELGDRAALAYALAGRGAAVMEGPVIHIPDPFVPAQLVDAATAAGDRELLFEGRMHELLAHLARGDMKRAMRTLDVMHSLAESLRQPPQLLMLRRVTVSLRLLSGDFDQIEAAIDDNERDIRQGSLWEAGAFTALHRFILHREQGRLDQLGPELEQIIHESPARHIFRCALALMHAELGETGAARRVVDEVLDEHACRIPYNNDWSASMAFLGDAVAILGLDRHAKVLQHLLEPAAGACMDTLEAPLGSLARPLGLAASTAGDLDAAVEHLTTAIEVNGRLCARPWLARAEADLGAVLLHRDSPGDADRAHTSIERAIEIATSIGQHAVVELAERSRSGRTPLQGPPDTVATPQTQAPGRSATRSGTFRREGEYWLVALDGHESRLRDTKGFGYLRRLLEAGGAEIHVLDLCASDDGRRRRSVDPDIGEATGRGTTGPLLDPQAKAAYRQRIAELEEELEEAESWNDPARAERARQERDFIIEELTAATGLGGRPRMATSDVERARVNVTRAIRSAISRIIDSDPVTGGHLQAAIRTGTFCCYEPDPSSGVRWTL